MPETSSLFAGTELPRFATIRETARLGIISEHALRILVKQGRCPGFATGKTFRVNVGRLIEDLNRIGGTVDAIERGDE